MKIKAVIATDKGIVKSVNQDATMVKVANSKEYGRVALAAICDGMGGLESGEVASSMMIKVLSNWFEETLPKLLVAGGDTARLDNDASKEDITNTIIRQLIEVVDYANDSIVAYGKDRGIELGTTVVAFLSIDKKFVIMNVGDSRIYSKSYDKDSVCITHDQSVVQKMIDEGKMTKEEAANSDKKSILLQCVGVGNVVVPEFKKGYISLDTSFLLCSDGFWRLLDNKEIDAALKEAISYDEEKINHKLNDMIYTLKNRNETDNISAIMITCIVE